MPTDSNDSSKQNSAAPESSDDLTPVPPGLLQNIDWILKNWHKHPKVIVVALLLFLFSGAISYRSEIIGLLSIAEPGKVDTPSLAGEPSNIKSSEKSSRPALRVRFRDGTIGLVEMNVSLVVDKTAIIEVIRNYGEQEDAIAELMVAVKGAAYKALESMTIEEARLKRGEVETFIIDATKDAQKRTGHTIVRATILEITTAK